MFSSLKRKTPVLNISDRFRDKLNSSLPPQFDLAVCAEAQNLSVTRRTPFRYSHSWDTLYIQWLVRHSLDTVTRGTIFRYSDSWDTL